MRILGVDLGVSCGWALLDTETGEFVNSGAVLLFARGRDKEDHARYVHLAEWIRAWVSDETEGPDLIAYEKVEHAPAVDSAHSYGGLRGVLLLTAAEHGVRYLGVNVAKVKKAAGLRSHASKDQILAAARARWPGYEFASDDEADARWVALAAAAQIQRR